MPAKIDLTLLPAARYAGQERPELMGLHAAEPPRKTARGRAEDRLILYLSVDGNAPLPPGKRDSILADLAKLFFQTPGSVTSAMKAVAEELNSLLLERNLRVANSGRQGIGNLCQVVLRGEQLYLAQSGPVHAYLISADETQHYHDPGMIGRGLGQSRTPLVVYSQTKLIPNDTLLLAIQPPLDWNISTLAANYGQGPESLRRKLFHQGAIDLNAVLIQAKAGRGRFYLPLQKASRSAPAAVEAGSKPAKPPASKPPLPAPVISSSAPDSTASGGLGAASVTAGAVAQVEPSPPGVDNEPGAGKMGAIPVVDDTAMLSPSRIRPRVDTSAVWKALAAAGVTVLKAFQRVGKAFDGLVSRLLPGDIPSTVLAFIAIAVPVIVVTMAYWTYRQLGRSAVLEMLYAQAEQQAVLAIGQPELIDQRNEWEQVLGILQQASEYGDSPEIETLRAKARRSLDELDLVRRVDYQPAIAGALPDTVNIVRIVSAKNDLYLLDGNSGNVIRALPTNQGYVVDSNFHCGPGPVGVSDVGPLTDILPWPQGYDPAASILALDPTGKVLFCSPDEPAKLQILKPPPNPNWGNLGGFTLDFNDLYVLDPPSNAVWLYSSSNFIDEPRFVFDEEVPEMDGVRDLVVNRSELYLLHADGHMTMCDLGALDVTPTRCTDQPYIDFRPGRENVPLILSTPFTQVSFTPPPDPSLFLLEPQSHAIYHFSLRNLVFQRQYLPDKTLSNRQATAFFVNPVKHNIFLAIGNQVYYAILP